MQTWRAECGLEWAPVASLSTCATKEMVSPCLIHPHAHLSECRRHWARLEPTISSRKRGGKVDSAMAFSSESCDGHGAQSAGLSMLLRGRYSSSHRTREPTRVVQVRRCWKNGSGR